MPNEAIHLQQARRNRDFVLHLVSTSNQIPSTVADVARQWAVTASFYAAVHAVEAHFATLGVHHRTHAGREWDMARDTTLPPAIRAQYAQMKAWSMLARYEGRQFTAQYVTTNVLPTLANILTHFGI